MELSKPWRLPDQEEIDRQAAKVVEDAIADIYVYSYSQLEAIEAVKAQYDALTEAQKELVPNYGDLEKALADVYALEGTVTVIKDQSSHHIDTEIPRQCGIDSRRDVWAGFRREYADSQYQRFQWWRHL